MAMFVHLSFLGLFVLAHANVGNSDELLTRLERLEQNDALLIKIVEELTKELAEQKRANTEKDAVIKGLHDSVASCVEHVDKRLVMDEVEAVGFHAVVSKQELTHLPLGQPIIFETVFTNVGGAYHNNHGLFIAPVRGLYMFSASVLSDYDPHKHIETSLVVNGTPKAKTHSYSADGYRDQGSATMVVELNPGDEVWVRLEYPNDDYLFGYGWTSFTGALIARL